MRSDLVFLFSRETEPPDRFFQGYFFHDTDYVSREAGFEAFCQAKVPEQVVREDGCYVQVEKQQDGCYRFSADYNGYKKLFYFWSGGFWVVSNSLHRICAHLRRHGYPVLPDHAQLAAMATEGTFYPSGRGSFFSQLTSFNTIVRGVRLVPADCTLRIGPRGVSLQRTVHHPSNDDYRSQLRHFIGTWVGRLQTLLKEPSVQISCDLTGGLDSRTVFALLLNALRGKDFSITDPPRVFSGMGAGTSKDRAVAARICKHVGVPLNRRLRERPLWLNGKTSYALWKDLCLGVYFPIYFPNALPSGNIVCLGGGGGENHRPFYAGFPGAPSAGTFVARRARNIAVRSARPGFELALRQTIGSIAVDSPEYLDALVCHYRQFRNRFHAGREPQYAVKFQPLASKLLDSVTAVAGRSRFGNAQIYYDILHNLAPELLDLPFDSWRKAPSRRVRRSFTSTAARPCSSGTCFIGAARAQPEETKRKKEKGDAISCLRREFDSAKSGFAADLLGRAYIDRADRALEAAARKGTLPGPIQSKRISVIMACAMFES